jgi:hypothetical protein
MNATSRTLALALIGAAAFAACRSPDRDASRAPDTAARTDTAGGTAGMQGMHGMTGTAMMDSMQTHMRMMDTMGADQMTAMLPMHRQMVANMLSRMNAEMRSMNMQADQTWNAAADSLRQDLVRMPGMSAPELKAMMPAHHARMTRLMQMHRDMMARMRS